MASIAKVRVLLETIKNIALNLSDEEISKIGEVLLKAIDRMEKEEIKGEE